MTTKYEKGTFVTTPNKEHLRGKPPEMLAVFFWICDHADKGGICYPSRNRIAESSGIKSVRTVDKYIKILVEMGILEKTKRKREGSNENFSNLYQIMTLDAPEPAIDARPSATIDTTPRAPNVPITQPIINSIQLTQLPDGTSVPVEEKISPSSEGTLPLRLGKTPVERLIRVYTTLWQKKYNSPYKVSSYGKYVKLYSFLLKDNTEQQISCLLLTHFDWHGGSGNDQSAYKWLSDKGFPLEYLIKNQSIYIAFLTNNIGLCYTSPQDVTKYLARHLKPIL